MNDACLPAPSAPPPEWQIWFDGSAFPNPGRIGLGAVLLGPEGQRMEFSGLAPKGGCNNEAELLALGKALELAREAGASRVLARGDSDFVVRHVNGSARTEVARLKGLVERVRLLLASFAEPRLEWVPRHRNPDADRLSRAALGLPDKPAPRPVARKRR